MVEIVNLADFSLVRGAHSMWPSNFYVSRSIKVEVRFKMIHVDKFKESQSDKRHFVALYTYSRRPTPTKKEIPTGSNTDGHCLNPKNL